MRRIKKPVFFIVSLCIVIFGLLTTFGIHYQYGDITHTYIKGVKDIRWGIDIRGGVDATFSPANNYNATKDEMDAAKTMLDQRLISLNVTDYGLYVDYRNKNLIVRFPWKSDESDFDPNKAVEEIGANAILTFREGNETDSNGLPTGVTATNIILQGKDVKNASAVLDPDTNEPVVSLELETSGKSKFAEATTKLAGNGVISIWMDDDLISYPSVSVPITDGRAQISGGFTGDEAKALADKINAGALPFKLDKPSVNIINPSQGMGARDAMAVSGIIGFILVAIYITFTYKMSGFIASIALVGQIIGSLAAVSGFFGFIPSFTLTIPGIAGIILSIGMGVDANVITSERIKEELRKGKSLDGSIALGYDKGFSAIFDGNVTVILVAIVLMGAFGPPDSIFAKILYPVFFLFGPSAAGAVYSFGYTLIVGVICNFVFGVTASRLMLTSISKFKAFRNPKLYGGVKND